MTEKMVSIPIKKYTIINNNDDFLFVKLQIIKEGLNLNDSNFLLDGMEKCKDTFHQKPLLCAFPYDYMEGKYKIGDGHNSELIYDQEEDIYYYSYLDSSSERCIGFIPSSSNILIENIDNANWITLDAIIWKQYYPELTKQLLKKRNKKYKISVEIAVTKSYELEGIEYIQSFIGDGITLLATDDSVLEGIPGANLQIYSQSDKFAKFRQALTFAYNKNNYQKGGNKKVFDQLSMNELNRAINKILDQYTYDVGDDWTRNKYWIEDIKGTNVIVFDNEEETYYLIPYSIDENNEVHLDMDNMVEAEYEAIPKQTFAKNVLFIAKDKLGTKDALIIDKKKDSMSETAWGDVDKSQLKKDCLMAKNYKAVCKAVFLKLEDGWLDGKEGSLGYPVMQKSGDKVIYNRYALSSAKAYAEKNNESDVLAKVNAIYKKLGLDNDQKKKEEQSLKYIEQAKQSGYAFLGLNKGNLLFVKETECDMPEGMSDMENMSLYTINFEDVKDDEKEFKSEDLKEETLKMEDQGGEKEKELEKLKEEKESLAKEKKEVEAKYTELEQSYEAEKANKEKLSSEKEEMAKEQEKLTEAKKEIEEKYSQILKEQFETETDAILSNEDLALDDSEIEEIRTMRKENKFASVEEFIKEIAYRQFNKKNKNNGTGLTFGLVNKMKNNNQPTDDLDQMIKKYN